MKTMQAAELKQKLEDGSVVLIDVREPAEHNTECIENAHLIPLSEICLEKLPAKSSTIVIHCSAGKRSIEACKKLLAQDCNLSVYSLEGGLFAWKKAGYPVQHLGGHVISLDRQVQLSAGFLVFSGVLLAAWVNHYFLFIPGFIGLGLMFAGLSGRCGMAKLLAKMPWNR